MNDMDFENIGVKERILNVAIEEFAQNGYRGASTNVICKKADISKGLLYHYYNSKEKMYITVVRHVIDNSIEKAKELSSEYKNYNNDLIYNVIKNIDKDTAIEEFRKDHKIKAPIYTWMIDNRYDNRSTCIELDE